MAEGMIRLMNSIQGRVNAFVAAWRDQERQPFHIVSQLAGFARAHEGGGDKIRVVEVEYDPVAGEIVISKVVHLGAVQHIEYTGVVLG